MTDLIEQDETPKKTWRQRLRFVPPGLLFVFGVVLPIITLVYEMATHDSARMLFDPIPTPFHILMVAWVPLANLAVLVCLYKKRITQWVVHANGLAIGFAAFYSLLYLPTTGFGIVAVIFLVGFFLLAPLLSFITAVRLFFKYRKFAREQQASIVVKPWKGLLASLLIIAAIQLPSALTQVGLSMAVAHNGETAERGIRFLRSFGSESVLLENCYYRKQRSDLLSVLFPQVQPEQVQTIFYRVTGKAYNAQKIDPTYSSWRNRDEWRYMGNQAVKSKVDDLYMHSSIIDGSIAEDADVAYLEWTMVFENRAYRQAEVRASVGLPPGAVVSRVTLWIDGEEREAAFAGRGKVREAYRQVVQSRRDPLLVTTIAADTVLVQMFPVLSKSKMKARIGITVPLHVQDTKTALLRLPYFKENNFYMEEDLKHYVWMDTQAGLLTLGNKINQQKWQYTDEQLKRPQNHIKVERKPGRIVHDKMRSILVKQELKSKTLKGETKNLVVVLDGSRGMREHIGGFIDAITQLENGFKMEVLLASDQVERLGEFGNPDERVTLAEKLERVDFTGGMDNTKALELALDLARAKTQAAILWVHSEKPVELSSSEKLLHYYERFGKDPKQAPMIYDFSVDEGPNRVAEALEKVPHIKVVPRFGQSQEDIKRFFSAISGVSTVYYQKRERVRYKDPATVSMKSGHVVRLWANERVLEMMRQGKAREKIIDFAAKYQIVTPVSGAVVLENQQQYRDAGLKPVDSGSVPTIPEPHEWAMIIIALVFLTTAYRRRALQGSLSVSAGS